MNVLNNHRKGDFLLKNTIDLIYYYYIVDIILYNLGAGT